jgi:hypothetical protein
MQKVTLVGMRYAINQVTSVGVQLKLGREARRQDMSEEILGVWMPETGQFDLLKTGFRPPSATRSQSPSLTFSKSIEFIWNMGDSFLK